MRLVGYDYRQAGAYFLTIRVRHRDCYLGLVCDNRIRLSVLGEIVREEWERTPAIRPGIVLDAFVVMPNHLHAVVVFAAGMEKPTDAQPFSGDPPSSTAQDRVPHGLHRPARSLGSLVVGYKASTTKRINGLCGTPGMPFWQHNYYEHILRSDADLDRVRLYIAHNPLQWHEDEHNLDR